MKRPVHRFWVFCVAAALFTNVNAADLAWVTFYPLTAEVSEGASQLNAVLRVTKAAIEAPSVCFAAITGAPPSSHQTCPEEWKHYVEGPCRANLEVAITRWAVGKNEDFAPKVIAARLSDTGTIGLVVKHYYGGSGGSVEHWSLFVLKSGGEPRLRCATLPYLMGVELMPGGTNWFRVHCHDQAPADCVDNVLYRQKGATRIVFGGAAPLAESGVDPKNELPLWDGS